MNLSGIQLNPTPRMLRQFSAAWLVCFLALAFKFGLLRHANAGVALGGIALIGIIGLIAPRAVRWLFVVASAVTFPIGWVMTQLVLAVMFFGVLTPVALVFRLRGRDALQLRKTDCATYWIERGDPPSPEKYLKQF